MKPTVITTENFSELVINSKKPVILYFWHHECGPCRSVSPKIDALAEAFGDQITICKTNVREVSEPSEHFNVRGVPQVFFLCNGEVKHRIHGGPEPVERLKLMVEELLSCPTGQTEDQARAKQELDQAVATAQAEYERVCKQASEQYQAPLKDSIAAVEAAWKPIAEERDRLLSEETAKRDRGEISKDDWFAAMVEKTKLVWADERFKDAIAVWEAAQEQHSQASEPYWAIYEAKQAEAEAAFNETVRKAREHYQSVLSSQKQS